MNENNTFGDHLKNSLKKQGAEALSGVIICTLFYGTIYGIYRLYTHFVLKDYEEEKNQPKEVTGTDVTDEPKEDTDEKY